MTEYGVNIVGSLTNNNGVLSGFSINNYAQLNTFPTFSSASKFEVVAKIRMLTYPSESYVMIYASAKNHPSFNLYIYQNGNVAFDIGNGSSWVVDTERGTKVLSLNTWYWLKVAFTGSQYILSWSEDGITWTQDAAYNTTIKAGSAANYNFNIGIGRGAADTMFSNGEIDLNESYIKLDNNIWWRGVHTYNGTHIQLRRDVAANWTTFNPTLLEGEVGLELDTGKSKRGDGTTAWNSLAYDKASTALQSITSSDVTTALGYTPTDTNLSNLSSTGTKVLDGQWTTLNSEIKVNYTLGAGASESWTISGLPNDSYTYEVMGTVTATSTGTGGIGVSVKSAIVDTNLCRAVSVSGQSSTFTIPIGTNHKIGLSNINSSASVTINFLRLYAYRRIGTNS